MSLTSIAFALWIAVIVIQIGVSLRFLGYVKRENKTEYERITGGYENLWFAINPLRVGAAYADSDLHQLWGLSRSAMRVGRLLRLLTYVSYLVLLGFVVAIFYESLWP